MVATKFSWCAELATTTPKVMQDNERKRDVRECFMYLLDHRGCAPLTWNARWSLDLGDDRRERTWALALRQIDDPSTCGAGCHNKERDYHRTSRRAVPEIAPRLEAMSPA